MDAHGERYCALAADERQLAGAILNFGKERKKRYAALIGDRTLLDPSISMGGIENKSGNVTRHAGILERFTVSRSECDPMILHATCLFKSAEAIRETRKINNDMVCCLRTRI